MPSNTSPLLTGRILIASISFPTHHEEARAFIDTNRNDLANCVAVAYVLRVKNLVVLALLPGSVALCGFMVQSPMGDTVVIGEYSSPPIRIIDRREARPRKVVRPSHRKVRQVTRLRGLWR